MHSLAASPGKKTAVVLRVQLRLKALGTQRNPG